MTRRRFLVLLIVLSVLQAGTVIDFTTLDGLLSGDDHPKFFSFSVENARLLLSYGTPFGFNHDFQGGIPTLYLRSCFLELIPFALFFGSNAGYQIMLIAFLALIPLSFFYLVEKWTASTELAMLAAFLASFYNAGFYLQCGMTPAVVGYALVFLMLFFYSRYLTAPRPYLAPLLVAAAALAYTHLLFFGVACLAAAVAAFLHGRQSRAAARQVVRRTAVCCAAGAVAVGGLIWQLFLHRNYLQLDYLCGPAGGRGPGGEFLFNLRELLGGFPSIGSNLLLLTLVLGLACFRVACRRHKRLTAGAVAVSAFFLAVGLLDNVTPVNIVIGRIDSFQPYVILFDLALLVFLPLARYWRPVALLAATVLLFFHYPYGNSPLPTIRQAADSDPRLAALLHRGDFVLLENRAHVCAVCDGRKKAAYPPSHWETYLQSSLGVKMLAHMGEDAQPYNTFRQMYVVNGWYQGERLAADNGAALVRLMARWGVRQACVWSPPAVAFFQADPSFAPLGKSAFYTCFQGNYPPVPEVGGPGGPGELADVTPFSFRVHLHRTPDGPVIVNRNFTPLWSAHDREGRPVELTPDGQRLSFAAPRDGDVFFVYRRGLPLNIAALAIILLTAAIDLWRLAAARETLRQCRGRFSV